MRDACAAQFFIFRAAYRALCRFGKHAAHAPSRSEGRPSPIMIAGQPPAWLTFDPARPSRESLMELQILRSLYHRAAPSVTSGSKCER